jgi:hypothetical protein
MTEHRPAGGARPVYPLIARLLAVPVGFALGWCLWYALFRLIPPESHWERHGDTVVLVGSVYAALAEAIFFVAMPVIGAVEAWRHTGRRRGPSDAH